mmetsp:Transcript_9780/g.28704  ORF Transcript_9780/g.28704 Transcript_9780/m.28704 type:complete len:257 (-) Transcript_9780:74-844(-)
MFPWVFRLEAVVFGLVGRFFGLLAAGMLLRPPFGDFAACMPPWRGVEWMRFGGGVTGSSSSTTVSLESSVVLVSISSAGLVTCGFCCAASCCALATWAGSCMTTVAVSSSTGAAGAAGSGTLWLKRSGVGGGVTEFSREKRCGLLLLRRGLLAPVGDRTPAGGAGAVSVSAMVSLGGRAPGTGRGDAGAIFRGLGRGDGAWAGEGPSLIDGDGGRRKAGGRALLLLLRCSAVSSLLVYCRLPLAAARLLRRVGIVA